MVAILGDKRMRWRRRRRPSPGGRRRRNWAVGRPVAL